MMEATSTPEAALAAQLADEEPEVVDEAPPAESEARRPRRSRRRPRRRGNWTPSPSPARATRSSIEPTRTAWLRGRRPSCAISSCRGRKGRPQLPRRRRAPTSRGSARTLFGRARVGHRDGRLFRQARCCGKRDGAAATTGRGCFSAGERRGRTRTGRRRGAEAEAQARGAEAALMGS